METTYSRKSTIRSERGAKQHEIIINFDMTGVTEQDLIDTALRAKVVDVQAALRRLSPSELETIIRENNGVINRTFTAPGAGIESAEAAMQKVLAGVKLLPPELQAEVLKQLRQAGK